MDIDLFTDISDDIDTCKNAFDTNNYLMHKTILN